MHGDYEGWKKVRKLGKGGQGEVWLVQKSCDLDESEVNNLHELSRAIRDIRELSPSRSEAVASTIHEVIRDISKKKVVVGALKELHFTALHGDDEIARGRMRRELEVMKTVQHPNLLTVVEVSSRFDSFISEYHAGGILTDHLNRFSGRSLEALRAVRPLVEAVGQLHKSGHVHRDIKPANIFIGDELQLILGDFGLVFLEDNETRVSETFENVGSRDWMPGWAYGIRVESVKPTFDVFSLGKVLWSMISGRPLLQLWYFDRASNCVATMFPNDSNMLLINDLLSKCVVEEEKDCLDDASVLLSEIDKTIRKMEVNATVMAKDIERRCRVCGTGAYNLICDRNNTASGNFGIQPRGVQSFRIFTCSKCGHVDLFSCSDAKRDVLPDAWLN